MRSIFLVLALTMPGVSMAGGAPDGEVFGFQLGARYPNAETSRGYWSIGRAILLPERPEIPPEFKRLEVLTTPKTFTIGNIYAVAEYATYEEAKALAAKYTRLLPALYGERCLEVDKDIADFMPLTLVCGKYELGVQVFDKDKDLPNKPASVHVGLTYRDKGEKDKWSALFDSELQTLEKEDDRRRVQDAKKTNSLRGFN